MLKVLFKKEILENLTTRRFIIVLGLCFLVIPFSIYIGDRDYEHREQAYEKSTRTFLEDHKVVGDLLYSGVKAFRPPSSLSFISQGLELVLPNIVESQTSIIETPPIDLHLNNGQSYENLYTSLHGPLDLVFIVSVIMTFLAIIFSFGAISGEKEQGTLKMILCNAVPRHHILMSKIAANFLMLVIPFLLAIVMGMVILAARSSNLFISESSILSIAIALVFSFLTIGVFFNLGLWISALTHQAVTSFVILLLCWAFLFGIYPRISVIFSQLLYPVKSQQLVLLERNQIRLENEKALATELDRIANSDGNSQEKQDAITAEFRAKLTDQLQKHDENTENRRNTQMQIAINLARISPIGCFMRPMAEVSRTGWMQYRKFIQDVSRYRRELDEQVYSKYQMSHDKYGGGGVTFTGDRLAPAPVLQVSVVHSDEIIKNILPDAGLLLVYNIFFFFAAFIAFRNYDAR